VREGLLAGCAAMPHAAAVTLVHGPDKNYGYVRKCIEVRGPLGLPALLALVHRVLALALVAADAGRAVLEHLGLCRGRLLADAGRAVLDQGRVV